MAIMIKFIRQMAECFWFYRIYNFFISTFYKVSTYNPKPIIIRCIISKENQFLCIMTKKTYCSVQWAKASRSAPDQEQLMISVRDTAYCRFLIRLQAEATTR